MIERLPFDPKASPLIVVWAIAAAFVAVTTWWGVRRCRLAVERAAAGRAGEEDAVDPLTRGAQPPRPWEVALLHLVALGPTVAVLVFTGPWMAGCVVAALEVFDREPGAGALLLLGGAWWSAGCVGVAALAAQLGQFAAHSDRPPLGMPRGTRVALLIGLKAWGVLVVLLFVGPWLRESELALLWVGAAIAPPIVTLRLLRWSRPLEGAGAPRACACCGARVVDVDAACRACGTHRPARGWESHETLDLPSGAA